MIHAFSLRDGRLHAAEGDISESSRDASVWLDIVAPSPEEVLAVETAYGMKLNGLEEGEDIEASARFFEETNGQLHLRADFLSAPGDQRDNEPVHFIIAGKTLISVHNVDLPTFNLVRAQASTNPGTVSDAKDVLLEIYATHAEYSADVLEGVHRQLKRASKTVLTRVVTDKVAAAILARVAQEEDLNGNVRHNIADSRRAVSFLMREKLLTEDQVETAHEIRRDLDSLDAHTAFLFDKINFLMDATVGFVSITQNKVIKIVSVAAVAMLPPTLIASIYGMNFEHMPELKWVFGYPFALAMMGLSIVVPFLWFRQQGWLK